MWRKITIAEKDFVIRMSAKEDGYEIMLSNFYKIWSESFTEEHILNRCKEMNPLYEADSHIMINKIFEIIDPHQTNVNKEILEVGDQLTVTFSRYLKEFIFKFKFILNIATPEKFSQNLITPLFQIIEELQARQKTLCDLLIKKDIEINEYKLDGAKLSRRNVVTEPFTEENFLRCSYENGEERAMKNLQCPFTFFEKSCGEMYEECTKRKTVTAMISSQKSDQNIKKEDSVKRNVNSETSKRKKENQVACFDDTEDDETYFSPKNAVIKPTVLKKEKNTVVKKTKHLNL